MPSIDRNRREPCFALDLKPRMAGELGDHGDEGIFFFAFLGNDDGAVGEELEGAAGDAADLGDGGDVDGFSWVAEAFFAEATKPAEVAMMRSSWAVKRARRSPKMNSRRSLPC